MYSTNLIVHVFLAARTTIAAATTAAVNEPQQQSEDTLAHKTKESKTAPNSTPTLSAGKYSSSLHAVMDAGTLGFGLVVEMQNGTPAAVRAANT